MLQKRLGFAKTSRRSRVRPSPSQKAIHSVYFPSAKEIQASASLPLINCVPIPSYGPDGYAEVSSVLTLTNSLHSAHLKQDRKRVQSLTDQLSKLGYQAAYNPVRRVVEVIYKEVP